MVFFCKPLYTSASPKWDPRQLLEIYNPEKFGSMTCVGHARNADRRCRIDIPEAKREFAEWLLSHLAVSAPVVTAELELRLLRLAECMLCTPFHEKQSSAIYSRWIVAIERLGWQEKDCGEEDKKEELLVEEECQFCRTMKRHYEAKISEMEQAKTSAESQNRCRTSELNTTIKLLQSQLHRETEPLRQEDQTRRDEWEQLRAAQQQLRQEQNFLRQREEKLRREETRKEREAEEARKEQARQQQEKERKQRREEEQRRRAQAAAAARERKEKEEQEWRDRYTSYESRWADLKRTPASSPSRSPADSDSAYGSATSTPSKASKTDDTYFENIIPWPTRRGTCTNLTEEAVEEFYANTIKKEATKGGKPVGVPDADLKSRLRTECMRWHSDKIGSLFVAVKGEAVGPDPRLVGLFNTVMRVVIKMRQNL